MKISYTSSIFLYTVLNGLNNRSLDGFYGLWKVELFGLYQKKDIFLVDRKGNCVFIQNHIISNAYLNKY